MTEKFFTLSNNPMGILKSDFSIVSANASFSKLFGRENNSNVNFFTDFFHPEESEKVLKKLNELQTTPDVKFTSRILDQNHKIKWFSWEIISDLATSQFYFSGTDITSILTAQSLLEEHTDKLLKIIELVPHPIFLKNSEARYILVNQAQADLFSVSKNDFIGQDDSQFIDNAEELKGIHASDSVVLNKRKNIILPAQKITSPNGKNKILYTSKIPFQSTFNGEINILGVSIDITEIKNSETELRKINFELDTFIYHASHDLRAPLCSLEGLLKLIDTETDEEFRKKCVEEGLKSIKRLDGFISDLTNLSRNNRTEISPVTINFKKIIKSTLVSLKFINNADKIKVSVNINQESEFYCDKQRMKIIFMNMISNAIKYQQENNANPFLSITINITQEFAEIEFKDNGIGIEEKYLPKVFDMFFRGTILSNGSGLGLYILKEILLKLEGSIKITSIENSGTSFLLKIPNANQPKIDTVLNNELL